MANNSEKFLWTCELSKDTPMKMWRSTDVMELESEDDTDFVIHSLIVKTAVLGLKAVEGERNVVSVKTKGYQEQPLEQPILSLTLGRNDMVSGLDLTLASDHHQEVEFTLIAGTGPVFITCTHLLEVPAADEQQTIMTTSDGEMEEEECEDDEDEEEELGDTEPVEEVKGKRTTIPTAAALKAALKNGKHTNGTNGDAKKEVMAAEDCDEKPTKRKRN